MAVKINGFDELAQAVAYDNIVKTHERRAKKVLIKQRVDELIAAGVEKMVAEVMAKVEYEFEYGL